MLASTAKILTLTNEAAVLAHAGRAIYANPAACAVLGENCVGKRMAELLGSAVTGTQASAFLAQIRIGGRPFMVHVSRLEEDQLFLLRPQENAPAVLNQPFLYALRSALMNMKLASDQLRAGAEDLGSAGLLESLRALTRSQYQILRILNNASLILSASEGGAVFTPRTFSLTELCASILEAVEKLIPEIRFQGQLGNDIRICADPELMKALVMNLLSNAIRHGLGCTRISLSLLESGRNLVLAVDDDGCGIPPEELSRVFDRYRHDFSLSQMSAGPGLGLTAARMIAQLHGGTLLLESRQGHGTTLRVSLSRDGQNASLHAPEDAPCCKTEDLLTGLADCLPPDCFSERYLD
jgi:signal transduction histidine kinase